MLYHGTCIDPVFQNHIDRWICPSFCTCLFLCVGIFEPLHFSFVFGWRHYSFFIQFFGNTVSGISLKIHIKDFPHYLCGFFIYKEMMLIRRIFNIPVRCKTRHKLSSLFLCGKCASDLLGNITAVHIIK